ncbi:MAG: MFS transporter [Pseudomonadales bacterium]|nr:MFS transporter [Pseudomonadales bacterium]
MKTVLLPIAALLLSAALLLTGHGLQLTLLPLSAEAYGFSAAQIGLTGSTYFSGFVTGCLLTPFIVRRVGHIRAFAVLATSYSALVLLYHELPYLLPWLAIRFFSGVAISGLYMVIESWLSERSTAQNRGMVLSIYVMINLSMVTVGQQLINLAPIDNHLLFVVTAVLLSLAIIPVSLTRELAPAPISNVTINVRKVWRLSKVGLGGAIIAGLVTGAFWSLGPLYARGMGLDGFDLTFFLGIVVIGGAVFQLPLGRLSDHYDRRLIVFFTALSGTVLSLLLVVLPLLTTWSLLLPAFLWGGSVMTLYAICLAHANDRAAPEDFVMVGSVMLLSMGLFSAIGSYLASMLMELAGPQGLFVFSAVCLLVFALAIAARRRIHVLPIQDETEPFRPVTETLTPVALELDPRTESES